jgi:tetratricopeptide (TPR) repeat protein
MLGPDHTDTLQCMAGLASAYGFAGEWGTSVRLLEEVLAKRSTICGPRHPSTLGTMHLLAMNYRDTDRFTESIELHEKVLDGLKSTYGPEHASMYLPMQTFAMVCQRAGKFDRADQLLRALLKQYPKNRKDSLRSRNDTATALGWLAVNLLLQEQYDEAEPLVRKAIATDQVEKHMRFYWKSVLGAVLLGQKKYEEAESFLVQGYEGLKQLEATLRAPHRRFVAEAGARVVRFYEVTNQPEKARVWQEKVNAELPNAASGGAK